jgi:hypothetical protein
METDIKSCPFCGGKSFTFRVEEVHHLNTVCDWHHLRCDGPGCCGAMSYPSKSGLVEKWNTRVSLSHPEPVAQEAVEQLAYKFQNIMAQKLGVDADNDIAGVGPASFAMARFALAHPSPSPEQGEDGTPVAQEQPDFTYYECPECGLMSSTDRIMSRARLLARFAQGIAATMLG